MGWFMTLLYSTPSPSVIPWTPLWPPLGPFVPSPSRRSLEHPGPLWSSAAWRSSSPHGKSGPQRSRQRRKLSQWMPNFHRWRWTSPMFLILKPRFPGTVLWLFKSLRTGKWPSYRWFGMIYHVFTYKKHVIFLVAAFDFVKGCNDHP